MSLKRIIAPALLVVLFSALLVQLPLAIADRASVYESFNPILDVRRILLDRYVVEPDEDAMRDAMIDAMIDMLDDPYTQYVPPRELREFNKQLRGTYAGIGAEVNIVDGYLVIVSPMDDSPALRAGVLAGDTVLEIEGQSTFEMPVSECVELLTGETGTPVRIRVRHLDGTEEPLEIVRGRIVTRTVKGLRRVGEDWTYCVDEVNGLNYVRVTQFNEETVTELKEAIDEIRTPGPGGGLGGGLGGRPGGLILDLRDNPGGGLDTAVAMADMFLDGGTIVTVRPRIGSEVTYTATTPGTLDDFAMIVLVNGASASASEIVSGALQENGRARVLGTRTYGKGSVQEVRSLPYDGGTLKLTTAHYYLAGGRNLNRNPGADTWGVDPDPGLVLAVTDDDYVASFRARREYEIIRDADETLDPCTTAGWIRENMLDEQLAVAVETLRLRVETGAWPTVSEEESGIVAFDQEIQRATETRARLLEQLRRLEDRIDEIQVTAADAGRPKLLPPDVDLTEATLSIQDRTGRLIGTYRVEGGNLELALNAMNLTRLEGEREGED